jgi:glycosyltransferase involved in cell wall biosynthesis
MPFPLGIGIITYNRKATVGATIERVRALTREPDAAMLVADDGSGDGTLEMLREMRVPVVTGINMGIAWNKNRALFVLAQLLHCETVILLEDDTQPNAAGWEADWMTAARRWGHVNYAGGWMREHFLSGSGTPDDPVRATMVTAQCAAYSRDALTYAGYFDSRFTGWGHEHVEHTARMIRLGYGGRVERRNNMEQVVFHLINGGVTVVDSTSHGDAAAADKNVMLARKLMNEEGYRAPWGNDRQLRQFRWEAESSFAGDPARFALHPALAQAAAARPGQGLLARVWNAARR